VSGLELRALTVEELPHVHAAMLDAFADYPIPMQLSPAALELLVTRRGVIWPLSLGAFERGELVGYTLTARQGARAYDVMSGVRRRMQGRGVIGRLFAELWPRLRELGVERMQLEVITTNTPAQKAYERIGFAWVRRLICMRWPNRPRVRPLFRSLLELREVDALEWARWADACEVVPAWPSERPTIDRSTPRVTLEAWAGGEPLGFAIACGRDVLQLAVQPHARRRGVGSALLAALDERTRTDAPLRVLNVDARAAGTLAWLAATGAEVFVEQDELVRELA
jgi:ribosomal protein S18 acetylase RimI-like enzyme